MDLRDDWFGVEFFSSFWQYSVVKHVSIFKSMCNESLKLTMSQMLFDKDWMEDMDGTLARIRKNLKGLIRNDFYPLLIEQLR